MVWTQRICSSAAHSVKASLERLAVSYLRETYYRFYFIRRNLPIRRKDLLWLALAPAYLMLDTLRHEISHALAAWLNGTRVLAIHVLPGTRLGYFSFGYTILDENATWLIYAAPYLCDLVLFTITWALLRYGNIQRRWIGANLALVGFVSPLFNTITGFVNSFRITNDITYLTILSSRMTVIYIFILIMGVYFAMLRRLYRFCIFHARAQMTPFWQAWAEGKRAFQPRWLVW